MLISFPTEKSPKVNVIAWLEFELFYNNVAVQNVSHYTTEPRSRCLALTASLTFTWKNTQFWFSERLLPERKWFWNLSFRIVPQVINWQWLKPLLLVRYRKMHDKNIGNCVTYLTSFTVQFFSFFTYFCVYIYKYLLDFANFRLGTCSRWCCSHRLILFSLAGIVIFGKRQIKHKAAFIEYWDRSMDRTLSNKNMAYSHIFREASGERVHLEDFGWLVSLPCSVGI